MQIPVSQLGHPRRGDGNGGGGGGGGGGSGGGDGESGGGGGVLEANLDVCNGACFDVAAPRQIMTKAQKDVLDKLVAAYTKLSRLITQSTVLFPGLHHSIDTMHEFEISEAQYKSLCEVHAMLLKNFDEIDRISKGITELPLPTEANRKVAAKIRQHALMFLTVYKTNMPLLPPFS